MSRDLRGRRILVLIMLILDEFFLQPLRNWLDPWRVKLFENDVAMSAFILLWRLLLARCGRSITTVVRVDGRFCIVPA